MKDNKLYILMVLLIVSILFSGIMVSNQNPKESRFEIHVVNDSKVGVYDKENKKFYVKSVPNVNYTEWITFIDLEDFE